MRLTGILMAAAGLLMAVHATSALGEAGLPDAPGPGALPALSALPLLDPLTRVGGASSHALDGSNRDSGGDLYRDTQGRYVLMEATGPGAITRLWMTRPDLQDDEREIGRVQIFFDGESTPRVDLPASELFSGRTAPFLAPLCGNQEASSGGDYCDLRMPYRSSVRVAVTGKPPFFNLGYETYPAGTRVETFDPRGTRTLQDASASAAILSRAGADPEILPNGQAQTGAGMLLPGERATLADVEHPGAIRALSLRLDPHDDAALQNVWLEARWDGATDPAVAAPLADLFLSGAGERSPARGLLAGYDPTRHEGYLYLPMPFAHSARLQLVNRGKAPVNASWRVEQAPAAYAGAGGDVGEFHATFAREPSTTVGRDYVMLDAPGEGKVVGFSFTEQGPYFGDLPVFMEGDERVYIDGSKTPQIYGTGTEDFFDGGYYYFPHGPFTLPSHGLTDKETVPGGGRTSQYRLLLDDPWPFRDGIRLGIEHGGGDGIPTSARSVVFWYGSARRATELTDTLDLGDKASLAAAGYRTTDTDTTERLAGFYEGDLDGNISSPAFDAAILPGSQPPPDGQDPLHQSVRETVLRHPPGSTIDFVVQVAPNNDGVILRRRLDQASYGQRAEVLVDGAPVGVWFTAGANSDKRWADSDFSLPARLTAGKSRLRIGLRVLSPVGAPGGASLGWTDSAYWVRSIL